MHKTWSSFTRCHSVTGSSCTLWGWGKIKLACPCVLCFACGSWTFFLVGFFFKSTLDCSALCFFLDKFNASLPISLNCSWEIVLWNSTTADQPFSAWIGILGQLYSLFQRHFFMDFSWRFGRNGCLAYNSDWLKSR